MIKDVVDHNGLLGIATGTFVCMVGHSEKAGSDFSMKMLIHTWPRPTSRIGGCELLWGWERYVGLSDEYRPKASPESTFTGIYQFRTVETNEAPRRPT